eukprot:5178605-Amphidinium_carterae.1
MSSIGYSERTQTALAGGTFDTRCYIAKPKFVGVGKASEDDMQPFRNKLKLLDLLLQFPELTAPALTF